jgi:hypothetical protein
MEHRDIYDKSERAEEDVQIIRSEIQRLLDKFRKRNGGAIISEITVARGKVNLSVQFPKSWRPFRGHATMPSRPKRRE